MCFLLQYILNEEIIEISPIFSSITFRCKDLTKFRKRSRSHDLSKIDMRNPVLVCAPMKFLLKNRVRRGPSW